MPKHLQEQVLFLMWFFILSTLDIYHPTNALYVILSLSNFCGLSVSEQAKAQGASRRGISFKISVTFGWDVTFVKISHPNSLRDPFVA
ncbi:MAG: hypothetical protein IKV02_04015, partial [Clostridia bacterium]|nr:hypothetical protein [Clostridia bacterium]